MNGCAENSPAPSVKIGQALYTWAEMLPGGKQGEGFIAASTSLAGDMDWLNASCRPLIGYVGNKHRVTAEQRASYKPIGRHVHTAKAFVYRKTDVGSDSHGRRGNYLIHFLIAPSSDVGLSDVLRLKEGIWDFQAARMITRGSGKLGSMPDVDLTEFRNELLAFSEFEEPDPSAIAEALIDLGRAGVVDATDLDTSTVLGMLSVLPYWVDYAAELSPEWSDRGPISHLRLGTWQANYNAGGEDRRYTPERDDLSLLRERLKRARNLDELRSLMSSAASLAKSSPSGAVKVKPNGGAISLEDCIQKWLDVSQAISQDERQVLMHAPPWSLVSALASRKRHLPIWRSRDDIALSLLTRCEGTDQQMLGKIMPLDDESVSRYVTACLNTTVLEAAVFLNHEESRHIDIVFPDGVAPTTLLHLVKLCTERPEFYKGLVRSVQISCIGAGSFVRRLLRNPGMEFNYLYSQVLPAAADGNADVLWALASVNPEKFASWVDFPEVYADALISALRRAGSHPHYGRNPGLIERFRGREVTPLGTDTARIGGLDPVKSQRSSRRKSRSGSRHRRRNQGD
jgi:GTPase-associated protein 1, N-terminal domain type 2